MNASRLALGHLPLGMRGYIVFRAAIHLKTWGNKEDFGMSKDRFCLRRFRSANGYGLVLFQPERLNPWRLYFMLSFHPRQRRLLLRLARHLIGLSWWPPRFWSAAALLAERETTYERREAETSEKQLHTWLEGAVPITRSVQ